MRLPRLRIAWLMVAVAIVAVDLGAIRALIDLRPPRTGHLLLVGALPMLNVLGAGMLVARQRPTSRPFLIGFEVFGMMALGVYVGLVTFSGDAWIGLYVMAVLGPLQNAIGTSRSFVAIALIWSSAAVVLGLPQLVFAVLGSFLSRMDALDDLN